MSNTEKEFSAEKRWEGCGHTFVQIYAIVHRGQRLM